MRTLMLCLAGGLAVRLLCANPCAPIEPWLTCSLDDEGSVMAVGGAVTCGGFVPSPLVAAFRAAHNQDACLTLPAEFTQAGFPWDCGSLDFWFRLAAGFQGTVPAGLAPGLVMLEQAGSRYGIWLGQGSGTLKGLVGAAGVGNECATTTAEAPVYADILPPPFTEEWHHVALFWCAEGIPDVQGHRVALCLDGQLHGEGWLDAGVADFPALPQAALRLVINQSAQGICEVDELHVFPYSPDWNRPVSYLSQRLMQFSEFPEYICLGAEDGTERFSLPQNQPNPFNPRTVIRFQLPQTERVNLEVFDLGGRQVATLVQGILTAGEHEVPFSGESLPSGLYYYRLEAGDFRETRGMLLLK
jgi:hypothetical protein